MQTNNSEVSQDGLDLDLKELIQVLLQDKKKLIVISLLITISSMIFAFLSPNLYKAEVILAPAQSSQGDLSGALGQLGGLASVAGINIDNTEGNESKIAQEVMKSWSFIDEFISKNNLSVDLYAANGWNKNENVLLIDNGIFDVNSNKWLTKNENGIVGSPTSWTLFEEFTELLEISEDNKTGLVSVSIEHYSPYIAKQWLDLYIKAINFYMQQRRIGKVTNNIEYLEAQINKTNISEMQDAFYSIMEEQMKNKMLAEASPDYVFVAISPSMVPEEESQPWRILIIILGLFFGLVLSVFIVLGTHYMQKPQSKTL